MELNRPVQTLGLHGCGSNVSVFEKHEVKLTRVQEVLNNFLVPALLHDLTNAEVDLQPLSATEEFKN